MSEDDKLKYQHGDPRPATELPAGVIISPDTLRSERVPPGQSRTRKWPVLQYGQSDTKKHKKKGKRTKK